MKKIVTLLFAIFILFFNVIGASAFADNTTASEKRDLKERVTELELTGGISAGGFYASNPGKDTSDNELLLSNFLVELSSSDENFPINFAGAFGETSTPSLLDTPENNNDFKIEYASLTLKPNMDMSLEGGLLQPNAGFENTYTYNNINVVLGVIASQQPYNAYGARIGYDIKGLNLYAGYHKKRLDDEEYEVNGSFPGYAWEIGLGGSILDNEFSIYHYHLNGLRNLTGVVIERTINDLYIAFNMDYWSCDGEIKDFFEGKSSIGGALYVNPRFGNFSIPLRLEYIDQGESWIYIGSSCTKSLYTATISPIYHFRENVYIRIEASYIAGDKAFSDKDENIKSNRIYSAVEIGYMF